MEGMELDPRQGAGLFDGERPAPRTAGAVSVCHGLRPAADGSLRRTGAPRVLTAGMGRKPLFADRRGSLTYIFTQEDDGTLYLEGSVDASLLYTALNREMGPLGQRVAGHAVAGEFVCILLEDGSRAYLRRTDDAAAYRFLGPLPGACTLTLERADTVQFTAQVDPVSFRTPVADLRGGVDTETAGRVHTALAAAWRRAVGAAHAAGYWVMPAAMRAALRLYDGTLLHVSTPATLGAAMEFPSAAYTLLPLVYDDKKSAFTGTQGGQVALTAYRMRVSATGAQAEAWDDVITGVELWSAREPDALAPDGVSAVGEYHDDGGNYLRARLPMRTATALAAALLAEPMGLHSFYPGARPGGVISFVDGQTYDDAVARYTAAMPQRGEAVLGYAGYLHAAQDDMLCTSVRGNPFVLASATPSVGGKIRALWPQLSGGGAYTRQYIYVSTEAGVAMLCHDSEGRHTNCRFLTAERVAPGAPALPTREGVYALTEQGGLICLRSARVSTVLRSLRGAGALMWSEAHGELWLAGPCGSLVMAGASPLQAFTRAEAPRPVPGAWAPALAYTVARDGLITLMTLDEEDANTSISTLEYVAMLPDKGLHGLCRAALCGPARAQSAQMRVRLEACADDWAGPRLPLADLALRSPAARPCLAFTFRLPLRSVRRPSCLGALRLHLTGSFEALSAVNIQPL